MYWKSTLLCLKFCSTFCCAKKCCLLERFGLNSLNLSNDFIKIILRCSLGFLGSIQIVSFSAHHLLAAFTHKSSVTVAELRDYITRRKNRKISIVKRGKNACTCSRVRIVKKWMLLCLKIFDNKICNTRSLLL